MKDAAGAVDDPGPPEPILRDRADRGVGSRWLGLLPVVAMFCAAAWQMRIDWSYDESYRYGWVVPALMAYLISVRWRDRPAAQPGSSPSSTALWVALGIAFVLTWLIREANPDWRLIGVALSALAVAAGLLWFRDAGGRAWFWHFAGAVAFFAVAVPWPTVLERAISGVLMPANAALTLEALHWLGVPAIRSGNLITLHEGTLGVEEACSGIRSLLSLTFLSLVYAFFFDEKAWMRWALLAATIPIAIAANALRVTVTGIMSEINPELAHGFMHTAQGWVIFMTALVILVGVHQGINSIYKAVRRAK